MDANKLVVLESIGYEIVPCCGLCEHGKFAYPADGFGVCDVETYTHLKHGSVRHLSVHRFGRCAVVDQFAPSLFEVARLDDFGRFFEGEQS